MNAVPVATFLDRLRRAGFGLLVAGAADAARAPALPAAEPGDSMEWRVSENPAVAIRFRHCPGGTIRPGKPSPAAEAADPSSLISIREFDIGETEVTIAQFRAVLGDQGLEPLKKQAERVQKNLPELYRLLEAGGNEPAFYVGIESAVDFCNALQAGFDTRRSEQTPSTVETRLFRLPSHVEWQYAARGIGEADRQTASPHFGRWVQWAELSAANQQKCGEVWQSLGKPGDFPGTQDAFVELTRTTDAAQQEKVKEVLAECFEKAFGSAPRTASGLGTLQPVGGTQPNAWNLKEVHEGVSEWAIWAAKQDRARDLWSKLAAARKGAKSLEGQQDLFLCGGSFVDSYFGAGAINRFTAWGGPKLTDELPQPFEFQPDLILEYTPGFRILSERRLAEDWLFVLRRGVFRGGVIEATASDHLRTNLAAIEELTEAEHAARTAADFYLRLVASQGQADARLSEIPVEIVKMNPSAGPRSSAGSKVADLFKKKEGASGSGVAAGGGGDDSEYFESLNGVLRTLPKL